MKFEVEILESDIEKSIQNLISASITEQTRRWDIQDTLNKRVKELWNSTVDDMITKMLSNSDELKAKITAAVEKKIRDQINAKMRQIDALSQK